MTLLSVFGLLLLVAAAALWRSPTRRRQQRGGPNANLGRWPLLRNATSFHSEDTLHRRFWPGQRIGPGRGAAVDAHAESSVRVVRELAGLLRSGKQLDAAMQLLLRIEAGETNPAARALSALYVQRQTRWTQPPGAVAGLDGEAGHLLRRLHWCFEICEQSGAPLAEVLERLAEDLEAAQDARRTLDVALAGPRATTRLLTWLPLLGLLSGALFGIDVFTVLAESALARVAVLLGLGLWAANRLWCRLLLTRSTREAVRG